jgi:hypothetical protein
MKYTFDMASCGIIYIPSFMKIDAGIQAILRFFLRNLRGCNIGITDVRDMNYAIVMGSGTLIHIPSFIKIA